MFKSFFDWLFRRKPKPPVVTPPPTATPTFVEDFTTLKNWVVSTWQAPGRNSVHNGSFAHDHVTLLQGGGVCLKLTQSMTSGVAFSVGGEIATKEKFGYGIYEFVVRASSTSPTREGAGRPVSGSITGCFNYGPSSITEIDIEVEGNERSVWTQCTSWKGETQPNEHTKVTAPAAHTTPETGYFKYTIVWEPTRIRFYRDGLLIATHTKVVPSQAAPFMFNHWGTNNADWGGVASPGVDRWMYVKSFSYAPL
jgi:beta-glucanase (GH16 family)